MEDLILDPQLKYWVLIPISVVMVLFGLVRANVTALMKPGATLEPFRESREKHFLKRAMDFRENCSVLTAAEFAARQEFLVKKLKSDEYFAKKVTDDGPTNPLTDPKSNEALMDMAKGNIMNYIPQTIIMAWVNYFFGGFVIMKLPFPLTNGFKSMLQAGVATPDLSVSYVSSISWYFVNLFGLRPVYSLILNEQAANELVQQSSQQGMPNLGAPGGPKVDKVFAAEAENVQITKHDSIFAGIVDRVLAPVEAELAK